MLNIFSKYPLTLVYCTRKYYPHTYPSMYLVYIRYSLKISNCIVNTMKVTFYWTYGICIALCIEVILHSKVAIGFFNLLILV